MGSFRYTYKVTVYLYIHRQTDTTKVLDKIQETLIDLKHQKGEIRGFEIRDNYAGGRRLRSG